MEKSRKNFYLFFKRIALYFYPPLIFLYFVWKVHNLQSAGGLCCDFVWLCDTKLDLESLDFVPKCNITAEDSICAINRAKTQVCKRKIASLSCEIVNDALYVKRLPRLCRNAEKLYGRYIGCFQDDPKNRVLKGDRVFFRNSMQTCVDLCLQSGFQYAGLQSEICFCGKDMPSPNLKLDTSSCNIKCPGSISSNKTFLDVDNIKEWRGTCGGHLATDVFETGVSQDYELNNTIISLNGSSSEKPAKTIRIVFFLTLNGRSVRQVIRLIKAIYLEKHFFYIHVDSRQDYLYRELIITLERIVPNNVRFMKNRKAAIWGGSSLLAVLLSGMTDLITNAENWNWDWDYFINLSEADFPTKTTEKLEEFFSLNNGLNFMDSNRMGLQKFIDMRAGGFDRTFYECEPEHRMFLVADRKLPNGIMLDEGSDWIALHRDFVDYVVKEPEDELVTGLKTMFKYTLMASDRFFHTVLRNSKHCGSFINNNLRVISWKKPKFGLGFGCQCHKKTIDWCGCSPNDFRLADWEKRLPAENGTSFFARKFEAIVNQEIVNKLESWVYPDRFKTHSTTMNRFWLSLYHHHDLSPKPDDALVTLGLSLARIAAKKFSLKYNCTPATYIDSPFPSGDLNETVKLLELSAYNRHDKPAGILVRFTSEMTKQIGQSDQPETLTVSLESWFQHEKYVTVAPWSKIIAKYRSKIQDIAIGVDYDEKELIFRNFARSIGPFSEPVLSYNIVSNDPFNITAVFIDPSNTVQAVVDGTSGAGTDSTVNLIKPTLKTPLLPGKWNIRVLTLNGNLLAEVKMLVLPLEVYHGKPISQADMQEINGDDFDDMGEDDEIVTELFQRRKLREWIDVLVEEFYSVKDYCLDSEENHKLLSKWKAKEANDVYGSHGESGQPLRNDDLDVIETSLCTNTKWSSLFPDPKSMITGVDSETGQLLP